MKLLVQVRRRQDQANQAVLLEHPRIPPYRLVRRLPDLYAPTTYQEHCRIAKKRLGLTLGCERGQ